MTVFIKNSTFCKSSHKLVYVNLYINQIHSRFLLLDKSSL